MGLGDNLMAAGMARGAAARGKRIAFGNGVQIIWDQNSAPIFQRNPNVAPPGQEASPNLEWIAFYKGHRIYNTQGDRRWIWNYDFRAIPGEVFFTPQETSWARRSRGGFVVIEPNVPGHKSVAPNKDWGFDRYQALARRLRNDGRRLVQFNYGSGRTLIEGAEHVPTRSFRLAMAILSQAALYVGPEGGLHHAAAALGVPAVVLFGGFIPPQVTGYDAHVNLTGGAEACGSLTPCDHCRKAMDAISVEEVQAAVSMKLKGRAA